MQIKLEALSKSYLDAGRNLSVIDNLTYVFPEQGSVAIVGRSGVGKSTLLHLMGGLDRASCGDVLVGSEYLNKLNADELADFRSKNVGFVFQFHHLLAEFDALENVSMPLVIAGASEQFASDQARAILHKVGLTERLSHRPGQLSGGEQQRVAIARALVAKPKLVLADEPTGNLDHQTAEEALKLLLSVTKEFGLLLVIVTHNLELARRLDLVLEMHPGGALAPAS